MTLADFDRWCTSFLEIEALRQIDDSLNGIQVGCSPSKEIKTLAVAVDACAETIRRAADAGADVLFVHHGMFWGKPVPITGSMRERIRLLLEADMALYACHLPLDRHPEIGNNARLCDLLGLQERTPFGIYHGIPIGWAGRLPMPLTIDTLVAKILPDRSEPRLVVAAGPREIRSVAVISGGAPFESLQAIDQGIDCYVTGEPSHSIYHAVTEGGINFIAAGHYATEVWGVRAVAEKAKAELGLSTLFIDLPTGL